MMRNLPFILVVALAAAPAFSQSRERSFGETVRHNIEAQAIEMNPQYEGVPIEGSSGRRSVAAVKRYQNGAVKPLYVTNGRSEVGAAGGSGDAAAAPVAATTAPPR